MKFLADVNIPQSLLSVLVNLGHDVKDSKKDFLKSPDIELVKIAQREVRIILTRDKDFIALAQFPKYRCATIVIRLKNQNPENIIKYITELLENQKRSTLERSLTILTEDSAVSYPLIDIEPYAN